MNTLLDFYVARGYEAKSRNGLEHFGPCPFCQEGTDRFHIFSGQGRDGKGRYWCRRCEKSGDAIQFLRDLDGLGYRQALNALGIEYARKNAGAKKIAGHCQKGIFTPAEATMPTAQWQAKANAVVDYAQTQLAKNVSLQQWLLHERGLRTETVQNRRLGWIPQDFYRPYTSFGLEPEIGKNGKLRKIWIPQGLCIPVFHGETLVRIKIRLHKEGGNRPRYLPLKQPKQARNTMPMFLPALEPHAPFIVVESELDAILLAQEAGHLAHVMALGSAQMRPDKASWEMLLRAPLVLISLDFDQAGNASACRWWKEHLPYGKYRLWPTPDGKDPTDAFMAGWSLSEWVESGLFMA